jgi:transcriptional antiterminator NusG
MVDDDQSKNDLTDQPAAQGDTLPDAAGVGQSTPPPLPGDPRPEGDLDQRASHDQADQADAVPPRQQADSAMEADADGEVGAGKRAEAVEAGDAGEEDAAEAGAAADLPPASTMSASDVLGALGGGEEEEPAEDDELRMEWYILKVQVNREDSIRDAILRRIKIEGLEKYFSEVIVPTEEVAEFNKSGKRRIVKRKLYPGYILVNMAINDDTWFIVRETPGVGDFTGSAGKPTPMDPREVERILQLGAEKEEGGAQIKTAIPFRSGDRVRVKDGHFQNFEGEIETVDEANGRIIVMINIFNRSTPVELEHWQVEAV